MNDKQTYMTSAGALGKHFSIAILFLQVHKAQANPADAKAINLFGQGPLPRHLNLLL
jgi:hypothetical protein